jgi:RNA polymerase sigma factor (sigma-70 family)
MVHEEKNLEKPPVFEDHLGLVKSIVRSFDRACRPEDSEFFPVACMGLIKAIETFDPSMSKFSYWATKIIRNGIIGELRKERLDALPFSTLERDDMEFVLASRDRSVPLELAALLTEPSESDSPADIENKRILKRHYIDEVSMAEIAREVGFTRENIRQKVKKAISSIRNKHGRFLDDHLFWLSGELSSAEV